MKGERRKCPCFSYPGRIRTAGAAGATGVSPGPGGSLHHRGGCPCRAKRGRQDEAGRTSASRGSGLRGARLPAASPRLPLVLPADTSTPPEPLVHQGRSAPMRGQDREGRRHDSRSSRLRGPAAPTARSCAAHQPELFLPSRLRGTRPRERRTDRPAALGARPRGRSAGRGGSAGADQDVRTTLGPFGPTWPGLSEDCGRAGETRVTGACPHLRQEVETMPRTVTGGPRRLVRDPRAGPLPDGRARGRAVRGTAETSMSGSFWRRYRSPVRRPTGIGSSNCSVNPPKACGCAMPVLK